MVGASFGALVPSSRSMFLDHTIEPSLESRLPGVLGVLRCLGRTELELEIGSRRDRSAFSSGYFISDGVVSLNGSMETTAGFRPISRCRYCDLCLLMGPAPASIEAPTNPGPP